MMVHTFTKLSCKLIDGPVTSFKEKEAEKYGQRQKTGSYSKLLNDACHATAGMQSGGLLLGFNWTTFSKMALKAFCLCVCFLLSTGFGKGLHYGASLLTTGK